MLPANTQYNLDQRRTRLISRGITFDKASLYFRGAKKSKKKKRNIGTPDRRLAINWVRLARHISEASMVTYHFYYVFRGTVLGRLHTGEV